MHFFSSITRDIQDSFYNPDRYRAIREQPVGVRFRFALISASIYGVVLALLSVVGIMFVFKSDLIATIENTYPDALIVTLKDGVASANVAQPYTIPYPTAWKPDTPAPKNFIVIDTTHPLSIDEVRAYDAQLVLGNTTVFSRDANTLKVTELSAMKKDVTLDKKTVVSFGETIRPFLYGLLVLAPLLAFVSVTLLVTVYYLVLAFLAALLVLLVAKFHRVSVTYKGAYSMALLALIPVALFGAATDIVHVGNWFLLKLLVFVLVLWFNLKPGTDSPSPTHSVLTP